MDFMVQSITDGSLWQFFIAGIVINLGRYLVFSGGAYLFFRKFGEAAGARKIQTREPTTKSIKQEVYWSLISCLAFAVISSGLSWALKHGYTQFYLDIGSRGWWYFGASIWAMIFVHDIYFYVTHRACHEIKWLYHNVHAVHHRNPNPTAWSDLAFHPIDAAINFGIFPLVMFTIPWHPAALMIFACVITGVNIIGHTGYEFFPRNWAKIPMIKWITPPSLHNLHHSKVHCNYGLYFIFLDKLFGSFHPDTAATVAGMQLNKPRIIPPIIEPEEELQQAR